VNRSSTSSIPKEYELKKCQYNKRLAKISDRFIPHLANIDQLEYLFEGLGKLEVSKEGAIQLLKIVKEEIDPSILENLHEPEAEHLRI